MCWRTIITAAAALSGGLLSNAGTAEENHWNHYGGNLSGTQYSPLDQIHRGNVHQLEVGWTYRTGEPGLVNQGALNFEANPIVIDRRLYLSTGSGIVISLDAGSGQELWRYDPGIDRMAQYSHFSNRGVTAWRDPSMRGDAICSLRIFSVTLDGRIIALDGRTGRPCDTFGEKGQIPLTIEVNRTAAEHPYAITSPPVVVSGVLVSGSAVADSASSLSGIVRGLDPRTGRELWRWDPIPRTMADPAHVGWKDSQAKRTGGASSWAPFAADNDTGLVFVPTGSAGPDSFGNQRTGQNVYANSLVALDAETGEVRWHQQLVHHDLWDYDLASQPTLVNLRRPTRSVPAVIQATKMGFIFAFDRRNGDPLFAVEERRVPGSDVDGERASRTQLFPIQPAPLVRQAPLTPGDAWGIALLDEWHCARQIGRLRSEGIFTPPSKQGSIVMPSGLGGMTWGGLAFDPSSQIAVTNTIDLAFVVKLTKRRESRPEEPSDAKLTGEFSQKPLVIREPLLSPWGLPCVAPPWGQLIGVDMISGELRWQVPLGTIQDAAPPPVPNLRLGVPNLGGPIITGGGLVFIAAAMDDYLRAFDLFSGEELWKGRLPAGGQATPMTYRIGASGTQFVVIAAGGHRLLGTRSGDYVVAFKLRDLAD